MTLSVPRLSSLIGLTALLALSFGTSGCEEEAEAPPLAVCTPLLEGLSPSTGPAAGGTEVTLDGMWIATDLGNRDVQIFVGGSEATVTGTTRSDGCTACDACIEQVLRCIECERVCRGELSFEDPSTGEVFAAASCEETVTFTTPPASALGPAGVLLINGRGSEDGLSFDYTGTLPGDDDDSAGDDDDSAGDDDDSAGDDDDSAGK